LPKRRKRKLQYGDSAKLEIMSHGVIVVTMFEKSSYFRENVHMHYKDYV
jgi:hypothetical protein